MSSVFSGDHLRVDVRLGAVDLADVLNVSRADLAVQVKCAVSVADNGLSDGDPWVVVAEDTSILFVSRRIGGNLTNSGNIWCKPAAEEQRRTWFPECSGQKSGLFLPVLL